MRVAVGQFAATRDKVANAAAVVGLVRDAAGAGATLVVCPEASMYPFGRADEPLAAVAEPLHGDFVSAIGEVAAECGVTVVAGMFEQAGTDRAYNTVVAVGPDGLLGRYRKAHLFDALGWRESDRLARADLEPLVFRCADLTVGVLTCYDIRFPELARVLVDGGATLLAVPAAWVAGPLKEDQWLTLVRARAMESTAYVVAADQAPPDYAGRSVIVDPYGTVLGEVAESTGVSVAEATAERVADVRRRMPSLEHRRYRIVPA